jgi:outer membrane biosynthesis protein TonB
MNPLFDEALADAIVERNIIKHKEKKMHLFKAADGTILESTESKPVTREHIEKELNHAEKLVSKFKQALADYDSLNGQVQPDPQPEQPAQDTPTPVDPPAEVPTPQPEQPAEQPPAPTPNAQPINPDGQAVPTPVPPIQ